MKTKAEKVYALFEKHTGFCEFYRKGHGACTCGACKPCSDKNCGEHR